MKIVPTEKSTTPEEEFAEVIAGAVTYARQFGVSEETQGDGPSDLQKIMLAFGKDGGCELQIPEIHIVEVNEALKDHPRKPRVRNLGGSRTLTPNGRQAYTVVMNEDALQNMFLIGHRRPGRVSKAVIQQAQQSNTALDATFLTYKILVPQTNSEKPLIVELDLVNDGNEITFQISNRVYLSRNPQTNQFTNHLAGISGINNSLTNIVFMAAVAAQFELDLERINRTPPAVLAANRQAQRLGLQAQQQVAQTVQDTPPTPARDPFETAAA